MTEAALQGYSVISLDASPSDQERIEAGKKVDGWMQFHIDHVKGQYVDGCQVCLFKARNTSLNTTHKNAPPARAFVQSQLAKLGQVAFDEILQTINFSVWHEPSVHAPSLLKVPAI